MRRCLAVFGFLWAAACGDDSPDAIEKLCQTQCSLAESCQLLGGARISECRAICEAVQSHNNAGICRLSDQELAICASALGSQTCMQVRERRVPNACVKECGAAPARTVPLMQSLHENLLTTPD